MERYSLHCKNTVTGEWMLVASAFYTRQNAVEFSKIYTNAGFEIEIREWISDLFAKVG